MEGIPKFPVATILDKLSKKTDPNEVPKRWDIWTFFTEKLAIALHKIVDGKESENEFIE